MELHLNFIINCFDRGPQGLFHFGDLQLSGEDIVPLLPQLDLLAQQVVEGRALQRDLRAQLTGLF